MAETLLITLTLAVMVGVLIVSIIPYVPGPILMWVVTFAFGVLDGFDRLHPVAMGLITLVMAGAVTMDFWLPALGMRSQGATCWGAVGTIVGGLAGAFLIPIPICGAFIGAVMGALIFEFLHLGDIVAAIKAGQLAMKMMIFEMFLEVVFTFTMFLIFLASVLLTG
jgi:uncharacterized protein